MDTNTTTTSTQKTHHVYNGVLNNLESEAHFVPVHNMESYTFVCNDRRIAGLYTVLNTLDGKYYNKITGYVFEGKVKDIEEQYEWNQMHTSLLIPKSNAKRYNKLRTDMIDDNTTKITLYDTFSETCDKYLHYASTNTYSLITDDNGVETGMRVSNTCMHYYLFTNTNTISVKANNSGSIGIEKFRYTLNLSDGEEIVPNYGFIMNYGIAIATGTRMNDDNLKSPNDRYMLKRIVLFTIDQNTETITYHDDIDISEYYYSTVRKSASSIIVNKTFDRVCVVNLDGYYYEELDKSYSTYFATIFSRKVINGEWIYYGRMNGSVLDPNSIETKGIDHDDPIHYLTEYHPEYAPHYAKTGLYRNLYISTNDDGFYLNIFVPFIGINVSDTDFDIVLIKPEYEYVTSTARIDTIKKAKLYVQ
jgi:hypothetical protein